MEQVTNSHRTNNTGVYSAMPSGILTATPFIPKVFFPSLHFPERAPLPKPLAATMLIDLLDKLVDRVIQLATIQEQKRAKLLAEYLEPIFARFDQLNSEYLTAFERYRAMIANSADPDWLASLQATLEKDNLFTTHTRTQLQRLAEAKKSPDVEEFIDGICEYLLGAR
jgi:hypothetical protein